MNMIYFLGIDAGTTALKAALFNLDGRMVAFDRQEYQLLTPAPSRVELDAEIYWQALCSSVRNVLQQYQIEPEQVATLCISSQGETFIPVDHSGKPVRRAIVWLDNRATEEASLIASHFGLDTIFHKTGQPDVAPTWPACKFLWLRRNEEESFNRTARFLLLEDYFIHRLTGEYITECAQQTSSLLLDIQAKTWWDEMLDFVGITTNHLGRLLDPGVVIEPLSREGAEALGLTENTLVVSGSMDQAIGAVGAGNVAPDMITETTGGALGIVATLDVPLFDPQRRVPCYFHAIKDTYCLLPWGQTAGMALRWFRDEFFHLETQIAREQGCDVYDWMSRQAAQVSAGSDGLVALPHLEGAFCPEFNPAARAVFFGATLRHTRAHFTRAIMESVAFMLKKNLDLVEGLGIPVKEVCSLGGAARSDLWLQIKADVLQKPVTTVQVEESACLGAAILGAVASGHFSNPEQAVAHMVHHKGVFHPRAEFRQVYQERYAQYIELFDRLAPMFK